MAFRRMLRIGQRSKVAGVNCYRRHAFHHARSTLVQNANQGGKNFAIYSSVVSAAAAAAVVLFHDKRSFLSSEESFHERTRNIVPHNIDETERRRSKFANWAKEIEQREDVLNEIDVVARVLKQGTGRGTSESDSKSLIWHTLQGEGKIEQFRMWMARPTSLGGDDGDSKTSPSSSPNLCRPGTARCLALVTLGEKVCGHTAFVHGGMTAALLDDLFGWATGIERMHLSKSDEAKLYKNARAFTAKLTVNYRRPLPKNDVYFVECKVSHIEKKRKVWLEAKIFDTEGRVLVESDALYIITGLAKGA